MLKEMLFDATRIPLLAKGLDAYAQRHRAIADNVTNAETVGYERKVVQFEDRLQAAMSEGGLERTDPRHLGRGGVNVSSLQPRAAVDTQMTDVNSLNNVDIDREMADMAENHMQFSFASKIAKSYFELLQESIRGV
jgi:flagellar basal-body rod protein FlgB